MSLRIIDGRRETLCRPGRNNISALNFLGKPMIGGIDHFQIVTSFFLGKDPSPPLQFGEGPTTSPLSNLSLHFSGVIATMLRACTGPSAATSSFNASLTSLCRDIGVRASLNFSDTTTTLKWVSEPVGLYNARHVRRR
jgi:hypothetical protein